MYWKTYVFKMWMVFSEMKAEGFWNLSTLLINLYVLLLQSAAQFPQKKKCSVKLPLISIQKLLLSTSTVCTPCTPEALQVSNSIVQQTKESCRRAREEDMDATSD